jgi:POT family proton-dependent oligopeptide transporter
MGNKAAGSMGGMIDTITAQYDMSTFFLIFTIIPIFAGLVLMALTPIMNRLMHGIK